MVRSRKKWKSEIRVKNGIRAGENSMSDFFPSDSRMYRYTYVKNLEKHVEMGARVYLEISQESRRRGKTRGNDAPVTRIMMSCYTSPTPGALTNSFSLT